jgi:hypothetical protein
MNQAVNGSTPQSAIDQLAGITASSFTITTLAGRYAQLTNMLYSDHAGDEQTALETIMAYLEPTALDEALTLATSIHADLDGMASDAEVHGEDEASCSAAMMRRLANAQNAICRALKRHGARSLLTLEHVD